MNIVFMTWDEVLRRIVKPTIAVTCFSEAPTFFETRVTEEKVVVLRWNHPTYAQPHLIIIRVRSRYSAFRDSASTAKG